MKRKLIKEQNTTTKAAPVVVSATPKSNSEMLQLAKQHCNLNVNGEYFETKTPSDEEALGRQRPDGGYNYVVARNNQIWLVRLKTDNTPLDPKTPDGAILGFCNEILSPYVAKPVTSTQGEVMKHYVEQNEQYQLERPNEGEINSGKFKVIDMFDIKQEDPKSTVDPKVFPNKGVAFIYKRLNIENKYINQYPKIQTALEAAGYTFEEPDRTNEAYWNTRRPISQILGASYKTYFKNGEPYVWVLAGKLGKGQFDSEKIKKECREAIKTLYSNFKNPDFPTKDMETATDRIKIKNKVHYCKYNKKFAPGIIGLGDDLETLYTKSEEQNPFGMNGYNPTKKLPESTRKLQNLIRESLIETTKTKERNVLSEGKIVKARLSIISENVNLKTKKQKDKFFDELLSEMAYLNSQGFDKQVINEGFWDTLKGLFGHAPDGIMEYFKEYIAKWLVGHLTPMDPEGWLGNMIITGIGNLPIGDIPKLTDCNYLTKWISKTAAEGTVRKLTHEKGLDGAFYDILRNSIVDMLDATSLGSKIEEALGGVICPLLGGVKNKMEKATDTLKQKALATS